MNEGRPIAVGVYVILAGIGIILWSGGIVGWHCLAWLRYGQYPQYLTLELFADLGWPCPFVKWLGLQKMINWVMLSSAAGLLFWIGLVLVWIGIWRGDEEEKQNRLFRESELERKRHPA